MATTVFSSSVISDGTDPIFTYAASGDSLVVNSGVTLSTQGGVVYAEGVEGIGLSNLHATINGTLSANGSQAAPFTSAILGINAAIYLTVGSTGRLETKHGAGFEAGYNSSVANHGVIHSNWYDGVKLDDSSGASVENWGIISGTNAVEVAGHELTGFIGSASVVNHGTLDGRSGGVIAFISSLDIVNDGTIHGRSSGIALYGEYSYAPALATIENTGTIDSESVGIETVRGRVNLSNEGTIGGAEGSLDFSFASGADTVINDGHLDGLARLGGGGDVYYGESGWVTGAVWGQSGDDLLVGGALGDVLAGGSGDDTLTGGAGADKLTGAAGADRLSGGTGDDVFRFAAAGDAAGDAIVASDGTLAFQGAGRAGGDRIDVSAIDADAGLAGHQSFVFGSSHGVGHLWAVDVGDVTHIRGNVAAGPAPEFDLAINDGAGVHASDYTGVDFIL